MGTSNYDFTYIDEDSNLTIVEDTTRFLDEIDTAIKHASLDVKTTLASDVNIDEIVEPGYYTFDPATAAKCWLDKASYGYKIWFDYNAFIPQDRKLILPFHKDIIECRSQEAILIVIKNGDKTVQKLELVTSGMSYLRIKNSDWSTWEPLNANVTGTGIDSQCLSSLIDVAMSYIAAPTTYQNFGANWYTCTSSYSGEELKFNVEKGTPGLDCSGFVEMVSMGVPYAYSRFVLTSTGDRVNRMGLGGYCFDIYDGNQTIRATNNIALTNEKAEWFRDNGMGYYPNQQMNNIKPGDVFFSYDPNSLQPYRWLNISHCGIVVGFNEAEKSFITVEVAGASGEAKAGKTYYRSHDWMVGHCVYCARPTYGTSYGNKYRSMSVNQPLICHRDGTTSTQVLNREFIENQTLFVNFVGYITNPGGHFTVTATDENGTSKAIITTVDTTASQSTTRNVQYRLIYKAGTTDLSGNVVKIKISPTTAAGTCHIYNAYITSEYDSINHENHYYMGSDDFTNTYLRNIIYASDYSNGKIHMASVLPSGTVKDLFGTISVYDYKISLDTNGTGMVNFVGYGNTNMRVVRVPVTEYQPDVSSATSHTIAYE